MATIPYTAASNRSFLAPLDNILHLRRCRPNLRLSPAAVFSSPFHKPPIPLSATATSTAATVPSVAADKTTHVSRFAADQQRKGADVLVEALEREGVRHVFAYPGGASLEIHQALTRSKTITNILPRHEQGGVFAAEGYARSSGRVGVCIATSGPGATNLVSGLADAMLDSIPVVALTGQVPLRMIGTDAFQETPIVEVTKSITKHNYLVDDVEDIPRIVKEAFYIASSGRPESKRPILYVGGGSLNCSLELRRFAEITGIPVASTLMGLGSFPCDHKLSLQMLGMHGTMYANYGIDRADLLLAFGVRFDDRVTGKVEAFASRDWRNEIQEQKLKYPLSYKRFGEAIPPQYAIELLDELTEGNAIVSTGVGQHQMWAAQFYKYRKPRQWLTSGGLGAMGFGLPAAIGAAVANPGAIVVDIDGDGSFIMNVQELATIRVENLPVKIMILNNQHLGMVVQWEDRFYKIFPNMLNFAEACGIPAARVSRICKLREGMKKMLETPGPYLLDVIVPHQEHVLPMIPSGGVFKDAINGGDGRTSY
ncbi:Acetolactate synthase 3, chloroplastic [Linum perenne]